MLKFKNFLRKYTQVLLAVLALIFLITLFSVFSWGISDVVSWVNKAVSANGIVGNNFQFNIEGAEQLDLRGLVKTQ